MNNQIINFIGGGNINKTLKFLQLESTMISIEQHINHYLVPICGFQ